ncbi:MAG: MFS transporter [Rhodocyclaceae bacterium]|nr:MAG: MFS transporter [Rhodocyclaceae bacterium]
MSFVNLPDLTRLKTLMPADSLLRNRNFLRMWIASTVAVLGGSVSQLALPLTAVRILHASAGEMGLLFACGALPFVLFSLPAGVWLDRRSKRSVIVGFNLLGGLALTVVPVAVMFNALSMPLLYAVEFAVGTGFCIGGSAAQVFITQLVGRERLVEANSNQATATSIAGLIGPVVAGMLVGWLGAPTAVALDALAFLVSGLLVASIRFREVPMKLSNRPVLEDMLEGLRFVWQHPLLRAFAIMAFMTLFLFDGFMALYVLHATRNLHLSPSELAAVNTLAALGALAGAIAVPRLNRRIGKHVVITLGLGVAALGFVAFSQAPSGEHAVILAGGAMFLLDAGVTGYTVNYLAMRQMITPDAMLGRMTSTMRFLSVSAAPIGSSISGYCADRYGIAAVLLTQGIALVGVSLLARWLIARAVQDTALSNGEVVKSAA